MKKFLFMVVGAAALLAGCAGPAPAPATGVSANAPAAPAPPPPPQCNADGAKFAIGQQVSPQLEAAARVRSDATVSRVLRPHDAATLELNASRINLDVDAHNRVKGVRCG